MLRNRHGAPYANVFGADAPYASATGVDPTDFAVWEARLEYLRKTRASIDELFDRTFSVDRLAAKKGASAFQAPLADGVPLSVPLSATRTVNLFNPLLIINKRAADPLLSAGDTERVADLPASTRLQLLLKITMSLMNPPAHVARHHFEFPAGVPFQLSVTRGTVVKMTSGWLRVGCISGLVRGDSFELHMGEVPSLDEAINNSVEIGPNGESCFRSTDLITVSSPTLRERDFDRGLV